MSILETPCGNGVALIAGPTASGKSDLAIGLALAIRKAGRDAVVINADSAQVYADLQVLSARPAHGEMDGVPHRLFGTFDGAQACSAADWAAAAKAEIARAHAEGALPILVGGTGLYIRTLLDGIAPIPPIDPALRAEVRSLDAAQAYAALQLEDPARAGLLAPGDSQRIARALEVVRATGRTLGEWQQLREGGIGTAITLAPLVLLPDRAWLYPRCDARFAAMVESGALAEVARLLSRKLSPDLPVMRAIGVPELARVIRGDCELGTAVAAAQQATRNYAKRQLTWLRHQAPTDWPRVSVENISSSKHIETILRTKGLT